MNTLLIATITIGCIGLLFWYGLRPKTVTKPVMHTTGTTTATALLAGGCFWCVESDFEKLSGVVTVVSGYAGGTNDNPTYKNYGQYGHREVVLVTYDTSKLTFADLVLYLIKHSDPTDGDGSFYDRGEEYAPAVYFASSEEKSAAETVIATVNSRNIYEKPLAIKILPRVAFWEAEEYHQDYYLKNALKYSYYRRGSGRDAFIQKHWGENTGIEKDKMKTETMEKKMIQKNGKWSSFVKPSETELHTLLTPIQYKVTQEDGTETPFKNEYDKNNAEGIYVDILSGEPLYSSRDKYDSGTGWPSFVRPISESALSLHEDNTLWSTRTEVRSKIADSHLGHVFNDGPPERGGLRYCMNSAALRFVPKEKMIEEGYGEYINSL